MVDECKTVAEMEDLLDSPLSFNRHVAAVVSGAVDSALSVEMRTMLKTKNVNMVTCWTNQLIDGLMDLRAYSEALGDSILEYQMQIHDIFSYHDKSKDGFIEGDEQYEFAVEVANMLVPTPGEERKACLHKIWDTIMAMDSDGDGKISWHEFWKFVTNKDGPVAGSNAITEAQPLVPFSAFVLVVVQRADGSFCLVDSATTPGWWLVGGDVNANEAPEAAAVRVTREQPGIEVRLEGILRVEFDHRGKAGARLKTIYLARPLNDYEALKTYPDQHSLGAVYVDGQTVTSDPENPRIPLAGSEPAVWFEYVLRLGPVYPLEVLTSEGAPPRDFMPSRRAHAPFGADWPALADGSHRSIEKGGEYNTSLGPVYPNSP